VKAKLAVAKQFNPNNIVSGRYFDRFSIVLCPKFQCIIAKKLSMAKRAIANVV